MKQTLWAVAIAALVATALSFSASRWLSHRPAPSMYETEWLAGYLELSTEQVNAITALEKQYRAKLEECCAEHCAARAELSQSLDDSVAARTWVEKMCAANTAAEQATLSHILEVRARLTSAQQERYAALITAQLCTACPLGKHAP